MTSTSGTIPVQDVLSVPSIKNVNIPARRPATAGTVRRHQQHGASPHGTILAYGSSMVGTAGEKNGSSTIAT